MCNDRRGGGITITCNHRHFIVSCIVIKFAQNVFLKILSGYHVIGKYFARYNV